MVMLMKQLFSKIGKDIWIYIACIMVIVFVYSWIFGYITMVKAEEKIIVFIGSNTAVFDKKDKLNESRPAYLKEVEVRSYLVTDSAYDTCLSIFGYETGDILILPENNLNEETCMNYYAEISVAYQSAFVNLGWYQLNGKVYGLKIHDKESHKSVIDCLDYGQGDDEQNYYLLFNKNSLHISDLSDANAKNDMDGALVIANMLLSL